MNKIAITAVLCTLMLGFLIPQSREPLESKARQFDDLRHVAQVDPLESKATDILDQSENFDTVVAAVRANADAIDKLNAKVNAYSGSSSATTTSSGTVVNEVVQSSSGGSTGSFATQSYGSTGSAQYASNYGSTGSAQYQTTYSYPTYSYAASSSVPLVPASTPVSAGQVCVNGVCTVAPSAAPQGFFARLRSVRRY